MCVPSAVVLAWRVTWDALTRDGRALRVDPGHHAGQSLVTRHSTIVSISYTSISQNTRTGMGGALVHGRARVTVAGLKAFGS